MVNFASKKFLAVSNTDQLEWAAAVAPKSRKHHFYRSSGESNRRTPTAEGLRAIEEFNNLHIPRSTPSECKVLTFS